MRYIRALLLFKKFLHQGEAMSQTDAGNNGAGNEGKAGGRKLSSSHLNQITVLKAMCAAEQSSPEPRQYQINEISTLSGLNDEKEVQRYLFILEGQKLVSPYPEGDFTSKVWRITPNGSRALRTIARSGTEHTPTAVNS